MPFDVPDTPIESMTDDAVVKEAENLRIAISDAQNEIAVKKADAACTQGRDEKYLFWLAGARKYLMLLQARLVRLRPRERDIQIARHRMPR